MREAAGLVFVVGLGVLDFGFLCLLRHAILGDLGGHFDEAASPPSPVDVGDEQVVEDVASLPAGARQVNDLRIAEREGLELRHCIAVHRQLLAVAEEEAVVG